RTRRRAARRVAAPRLEVLEDRALPSGGRGPSAVLGELKSADTSPVSGKQLSVPGSYRGDDTAPRPGPGGIPLSEVCSGHPLPPALGPGLTGDMLTVNPTSIPFPVGQSALALVPLYVTGNPAPGGPEPFPTVAIAYLNPMNGSLFYVTASVVA